MITLLLTSTGIDVMDEIVKILPRPLNKLKLAHIITAANHKKDKKYLANETKILKKLGIQVEEIDIKNKIEKQLRSILKSKNVIYVQGGNTFYLLKAVRESGFDKVVKELINKDVIYIGVSAGSYICCPTIETSGWKKENDNIVGSKDLTAMNLVPFLMLAHYNRRKYQSGVKEGIRKAHHPVKILKDGQALLIQNGKVKFVGKGKEIKIKP